MMSLELWPTNPSLFLQHRPVGQVHLHAGILIEFSARAHARGPAGERWRRGPGNARGLAALLKLVLPQFAQRTRLALLIEGRILRRLLKEGRIEPHEAWARVILGLISMQEWCAP